MDDTALRESLRHWTSLSLDYEGLIEELTQLPPSASSDTCLAIARDFSPEALTDADLISLIRGAIKQPRDRPKQVIHVLSRRIDYVNRNLQTIQKRLKTAPKAIDGLSEAIPDDDDDAADLPDQEIIEDLDDDGRVVTARVDAVGGKAIELADVLEKVGVDSSNTTTTKSASKNDRPAVNTSPDQGFLSEIISIDSPPHQASKSPPSLHSTAMETLSSQQPASADSDISSTPTSPPSPALDAPELNNKDTPEEALLRHEMLNYGLDEVNAIVAELDLAEGASDVSYDDEADAANLMVDSDVDMDSEEDEEDDDDMDEDDTGATKHLNLDSTYKRQMEELQQRLGLNNIGPDTDLPGDVKKEIDRLSTKRPKPAELARQAALRRSELGDKDPVTGADMTEARKPKKPARKKVAFSEDIDVSDTISTQPSVKLSSKPKAAALPSPISTTILERSSSSTSPNSAPPAPTSNSAIKPKVSRFKQSITKPQHPSIPIEPQPPQDRLVANTVLERPSASSSAPPDPRTVDDEMHRKQVALEYHKATTLRIRQQGGFVKTSYDEDGQLEDDEDQDWYTKDEETGQVKKVSKFMAARMQ